LHPAELTVCCRLIRFSWHGAFCQREILRFSTICLPEVQKKRGADVDFQAGWAHVSNQEHQVSPRGASERWRESVRKLVSVHQDKIRGSAIHAEAPKGGCGLLRKPVGRPINYPHPIPTSQLPKVSSIGTVAIRFWTKCPLLSLRVGASMPCATATVLYG